MSTMINSSNLRWEIDPEGTALLYSSESNCHVLDSSRLAYRPRRKM